MRSDRVGVVVGVDGAGRTHRIAVSTAGRPVTAITGSWRADDAHAAVRDATLLTVVDDAHRLPLPLLRAVIDGARGGSPVLISRRPTIATPELAELDMIAADRGRTIELGPLTEGDVARLVAEVTGAPANLDAAARIHTESAGLPVWAAALASDSPTAQIRGRLARVLGPPDSPVARVATALAVSPGISDDLLGRITDTSGHQLVALLQELAEAGLLIPGSERLVPVVATVLSGLVTPARRRRLHRAVGDALRMVDPVTAADHLRASGATTVDAAEIYAEAGMRLRFTDPMASIGWLDLAVATGAEASAIAGARVDADLLLGNPVVPDGLGTAGTPAVGVAAAHGGRAARAADLLASAPPPGPILAVLPLVTVGRIDDARAAFGTVIVLGSPPTTPGEMPPSDAPPAAVRLAEGALALADDPAAALPLLIEAAEEYEQAAAHPSGIRAVFPDTPHAVAAVAAMAAGDPETAEYLLLRAIDGTIGGPAATERHRLLLGWVRMRSGRYDTARDEIRRLGATALPGRERMLLATLAAGLARRTGEVSQLREAWERAQPELSRRTIDLLTAEIVEELLVAATRLREFHRVTPLLDDLDAIVEHLGRPIAWQATLGWIRLQVAIAADDPDGAARAAAAMPDAIGGRQRAQQVAARAWADALGEAVDGAAVLAAADGLVAARLPWEASRLCGHAAIRTRDASDTRRLLERARDLGRPAEPSVTPAAGGPAVTGLSEREIEVARMVLAGQTYKMIGAQLFLSPKTVEHHVARIRTKLGAQSRAEMVAALREIPGISESDPGRR